MGKTEQEKRLNRAKYGKEKKDKKGLKKLKGEKRKGGKIN